MPTSGVRVQEIARLVGHSSASNHRHRLPPRTNPVLTTGAEIMDIIFATANTLTRQQPKARRHSPEKNHRLCRDECVACPRVYELTGKLTRRLLLTAIAQSIWFGYLGDRLNKSSRLLTLARARSSCEQII
jgi:hypothetical protein